MMTSAYSVPASDPELVAELRDSARRVVADLTDHRRTRALRQTLPGYDDTVFRTLVDLGWMGILVPEEHGGLGLGLGVMGAVVRELEKGLLGEPILPLATLGARTLAHADEPLAGELLGAMMAGEVRPVLALALGDALPDVRESGGRLTGTCGFVAGSAGATHFLVPATAADGLALHVIEAGAPGGTLNHRWLADETPLGELVLAAAPSAGLAASPVVAARAIELALDETRIVVAAGLVGLAEHMLDLTVEYMKLRKQFGVAIGTFQALQHKAVDLFIAKEVATSTLGHGLALAEGGKLAEGALRAKGRASIVANRMARECLHLHGAIGFTDEHDIGLLMKRALVLSAWLGNGAEHRRRFIAMGLLED